MVRGTYDKEYRLAFVVVSITIVCHSGISSPTAGSKIFKQRVKAFQKITSFQSSRWLSKQGQQPRCRTHFGGVRAVFSDSGAVFDPLDLKSSLVSC